MSEPLISWAAGEPEIGSAMDTLRIETIGHIPAKADVIRTRFPFHGFGIVLRGRGFLEVEGAPARSVEAPSVFYIRPGATFHYGPDMGTTWEERYLCFSGRRVGDWLRWRWLPRSDRPQVVVEPGVLEQMHRRICRAFSPFNELPIDLAKIEVEHLVHELHRQAWSGHLQRDKLGILIQRWIEYPESAGELRAAARGLGMSYSSFRQHFARRTGLAPGQFLQRLRVDRACLRLVQTSDAVKAIAGDCGFAFVETFNRAFRQVKGMTPGEYRRRVALLVRQAG